MDTLWDRAGLSLQTLSLGRNHIYGSLPHTLGNCISMRVFNVSWNSLSGTLPTTLQSWTQITTFAIQANRFSGTLPPQYNTWTNLTYFEIWNNSLSGSLPSPYSSWMKLREFKANMNYFSGDLPSSYGAWNQLEAFIISTDNIASTLPAAYSNWTLLQHFTAVGSVPIEASLANFNVIPFPYTSSSIRTGQLHGTLPPEYGAWSNLTSFAVANNRLTGTIPLTYGLTWGSKLQYLYLQQNNFTGAPLTDVTIGNISLSLMQNWTSLCIMVLRSNKFSGTFSSLYGVHRWGSNLIEFDIADNYFIGSLPSSISSWPVIKHFNVGNNIFSGSLPTTYSNWVSHIWNLDLSYNSFSGNIYKLYNISNIQPSMLVIYMII